MCDFPASKLLTLRRELPRILSPRYAHPLIAQIDVMRWKHFEDTGCDCWDEARKKVPSEAA